MEKVRIGIIGTSPYAETMHFGNLQSHTAAEIAAVCGLDAPRVRELAARYSIPSTFSDWRELIRRGKLQAVIVAAPHDLHYPITMEALEAGLHVLCEKPLAMTAAHAREMTEKAASRSLINMCYFTWRWLPAYRHALQLVKDGYIGRLLNFEARYITGYARGDQDHWRNDPRHSLGVVAELGVHMIDLCRLFAGDLVRVCGRLGTFSSGRGAGGGARAAANDSAFCLLESTNGAHGTLHASAVAHTAERDQEQHIVLHGTDGTLEIEHIATRGASLRGARATEARIAPIEVPAALGVIAPDVPPWEAFTSLFRTQSIGTRHFVDCILAGTPAAPGFADGLKAQAVIDAVFESDATGKWVSLDGAGS
ncbi:MAG TPA: Gfo/Idh/MocA family oxidoreductase [Spirochaetia bacterium]|nr:Gfo/Idh/MocA family oxidoreductase [Spirochaetia bacterium]